MLLSRLFTHLTIHLQKDFGSSRKERSLIDGIQDLERKAKILLSILNQFRKMCLDGSTFSKIRYIGLQQNLKLFQYSTK